MSRTLLTEAPLAFKILLAKSGMQLSRQEYPTRLKATFMLPSDSRQLREQVRWSFAKRRERCDGVPQRWRPFPLRPTG